MKMIIAVALALVAVTVAAPPNLTTETVLVRSENQRYPEGGYSFGFETSDGSSVESTGELKEVLNEEQKPQKVIVVRGSYTFPGKDGKPVTILYVADEKGYQPQGDSIPTPPPAVRR